METQTAAAPSSTAVPRLRRTLSLWDLIFYGIVLIQPIAPRDPVIAAYAATRPLGQGQDRLFVIRLTSAAGRPVAVPSSTAHLYATTAWAANRSWLFYQGPGRRMCAYQISSGKTRASGTPCCSYTVMVAFPAPVADRLAWKSSRTTATSSKMASG